MKEVRTEKGDFTYKDLGYDRNLSKKIKESRPSVLRGDLAQGDLTGTYPRPMIAWENGYTTYDGRYAKFLGSYTTATEPAYVEGSLYYNTDTGKLNIGGASGWEEITSTVVPSESVSPSVSVSLSPSISKSLSLSASPSSSLSASPSVSTSISPSTSPGT